MDHPETWPLIAALTAWAIWFCSWMAAALWSKRTEARPQRGAERAYSVLLYLGFALLILPTVRANFGPRLWALPLAAKWLIAAFAPLGFGLAWWARIHLARDWSWSVTRKEDHRLVDTGPYAVVRHPIYTGVLVAGVATAILEAKWPSLAGLALLAAGLWLKADLEERFLSRELGAAKYREYVARTGKLLPRL
jgi:protein-S-isoprenylcysteine O-methyltransferase Ste14